MNSKYKFTNGMDTARSIATQRDCKRFERSATHYPKRNSLFLLLSRVVAGALLFAVLVAPSRSYSQSVLVSDDGAVMQLSTLGKQGEIIARARGQALGLLQQENGCAAWFQEVNPDAAEVFRSLHFELDEHGTSVAYGQWNIEQGMRFKHPWGARSTQNAGRNSSIRLNANGPFFKRSSPIFQKDPFGMILHPAGNLTLVIGSYGGNTPEAQITMLLHELGHIIGRIPEDDDSWDGRSSRNTSEVSRHCKAETKAAARTSLRAGN